MVSLCQTPASSRWDGYSMIAVRIGALRSTAIAKVLTIIYFDYHSGDLVSQIRMHWHQEKLEPPAVEKNTILR